MSDINFLALLLQNDIYIFHYLKKHNNVEGRIVGYGIQLKYLFDLI